MSESMAERVRRLRARLGISQAELGIEVGVSLQTIYRWEHGRSRPSPLAEKALRGLEEQNR